MFSDSNAENRTCINIKSDWKRVKKTRSNESQTHEHMDYSNQEELVSDQCRNVTESSNFEFLKSSARKEQLERYVPGLFFRYILGSIKYKILPLLYD